MHSSQYKVFIQSNQKQYLGALLARYSLKNNSKHPDVFDVEIMNTESIPQLMSRDGQKYLRKGLYDVWSAKDLQSFTMTRFLPPQLMGFKGRAIVIDPDVFATEGTDIMDLFTRDMKGHSILACITNDQQSYKSSVMVLDCAKLQHWRWDDCINKVFAGEMDYRDWVGLKLEPRGSIGVLENEWNHCDILTEKTKLIHYTRRLTQPWKAGLPVDFHYDSQIIGSASIFKKIKILVKSILKIKEFKSQTYQENPEPHQSKFFFDLVSSALNSGAIDELFIVDCLKNGYVRPDFLSKIHRQHSFQDFRF